MKLIMVAAASIATLSLSACVSNTTQVKGLATADLKCSADEIKVQFEARPYVGTTHYSVAGCDKQRDYTCQKRLWIDGVPLGNADCQHDEGTERRKPQLWIGPNS